MRSPGPRNRRHTRRASPPDLARGQTAAVKGFAGRDVKAGLTLWQIGDAAIGGNLTDVSESQTRANEDVLVGYLAKSGTIDKQVRVVVTPTDLPRTLTH